MDDGLADLSDLSDLARCVLLSMFDYTSRSIDDDQSSQC
jgi:hypothetical protein